MARPINPSTKPFSEERKKRISDAIKRKWQEEKYRSAVVNSCKEREFHPNLVKTFGRKGSENPNWRGGKTSEAKKIRTSKQYKNWRNSILARDCFTCQFCGQIGGELNVDHIKSFSKYPELRFEESNGRVLCISCHKKTDTYSKG